jgi:hypothetical protein
MFHWKLQHNTLLTANTDLDDSGGLKAKVILRPTISRPVRPGVRYPSGTRDQFFPFSLWLFFRQLWICWCGAPSLTRSRVCSFQFLLGIARAAFLSSESQWTLAVVYFSITIYEYSRALKQTTHFHLARKSRIVELCLHSLIFLHGAVFNRLRTETDLSRANISYGQHWRHCVQPFPYFRVCICCRENKFTEPSNDSLFWIHYSGLLGRKHTDLQTCREHDDLMSFL